MTLARLAFAAFVGASLFGAEAWADTLYVSPDAPLIAHLAANAALWTHIGGGCAGILSGAAALGFRKGGPLHRRAGDVFMISMLAMAGVAAPVSVLMDDPVNVLAALFTLYFLMTAWMSARRRAPGVGRFDFFALIAAAALAVTALTMAAMAQASPTGTLDGAPPQAFYIFGTMAPLAAVLDLKVILQRGVSGAARIARHLWRMCFALFIATGSLFLGQQQVFPESLRGSAVLIVLAVAPLVFLIFWLARVRLGKMFRSAPAT